MTDDRPSTDSRNSAPLFSALLAALAVNAVIQATTAAVIDIPDDFIPLRLPAVLIVTIIAMLATAIARWASQRWSGHPRRTFRVLVGLGFVLSLLPLFGMNNSAAGPELTSPNATTTAAVALLHVTTALVAWWLLTPGRQNPDAS